VPWGADKAFGSIVSEAAVAGVPGYRKARAAFLLFVVDVISGRFLPTALKKAPATPWASRPRQCRPHG